MKPFDQTLLPFFAPQGVAVVGASLDPNKLGYGLSRNLVQSGYRGAIHFVNPKGGKLMGRPVYCRLADVPDPVDLAVVLIPAALIPQALLECAGRAIRAVIVASGGFRETGPEGARLEQECLHLAQTHGLRLIGPNCIGMLDTHLPIDTTFLSPPGPTPGDVAFISHSGAICAAVIDWARGQGFGLSRLVSLGNQADVNETDILAPVAADPYTHVLALYLEGVNDGRRFVEAAQQVARVKPVLALKVGRFASGRRAVASHTGALAGEENAYNAAFHRAGVIRVETSEELFDWARALAWCPPPAGNNVAILTNSGGPGVTAADTLESMGLRLAAFSTATQAALRAQLVPAASVKNPVDMLAAAGPEHYANCLRILLEDPEVHSVMVILPPPPMHSAGGIAKAIIPVIYTAEKPVVVALMGERMIQEAVEHFRAAHVPEYRFPERAAAALVVLARRAEYLKQLENTVTPKSEPLAVNQAAVRECLVAAPADRHLTPLEPQQTGWLPAKTANRILEAYGIRTAPIELAQTAVEAAEIASRLGFPVALKIASPDILHKSDIGGVLLNIDTAANATHGFTRIVASAHTARPQAEISGVQVQRMLPAGQDVIIGAVQDPQFGPLVMFGSGGVEVEGLKDVAFALAPLPAHEAGELLEQTWAGRKLSGYRHLLPADRTATIDALLRLAQLAADFPQLAEIEINPLRVMGSGRGVVALDVRVRMV